MYRNKFLACLIVFAFISLDSTAQVYNSNRLREKAITLTRYFQLNHYHPRAVNDSFSISLFDQLFSILDKRKMYFRQEDMKQLMPYRTLLDDELSGKKWEFIDKLIPVYKKRLVQADSLLKIILAHPVAHSGQEYISLDPDSLSYAATDAAWVSAWSKSLRFSMLATTYALKMQTGITPAEVSKKALEMVRQNREKEIKRPLEASAGPENYVADIFLNCIASGFDPHSNYFEPGDKQGFEDMVSGIEFSLGIEAREDEQGEKKIERLVPGGPAWKNGELHKGDVIVSILSQGREEDAGLLDEEALDELMKGDKEEPVIIKVRDLSGIVRSISLKKEQISNDENFVKGFVLNGPEKIGYIYLPGFYSDFDNENGKSCADDVARELVKLKTEKIKGLILDLRFNGGGSMQEAMDLAGIFINDGTLCAVREKGGEKPVYLKDMNRGSIYDGPMIVMVNESSASASEMVSSVLQDYNRAIIAGNRTYGKGTMQRVLPLDTLRTGLQANNEDGFVKITIGKFYRVSGKTVQKTGVIPDILFPGIFDYYPMHESDEPFALSADTIKKGYYSPLPALPYLELNAKSGERVKNAAWAKNIRLYAAFLKDYRHKRIELTEKGIGDYMGSVAGIQQSLNKETGTEQTGFIADITSFDRQRWQPVPEKLEAAGTWTQTIQHDPVIGEVYQVMLDYLHLKN